MAANKKPQYSNELTFVNYELNTEERARCKEWIEDANGLDLYALAACNDGYRFSLKYDERSRAFACFMSATTGASADNSGLMLTGRGSTPFKALRQCLYKHLVVFDKQWGGYANPVDWSAIDD